MPTYCTVLPSLLLSTRNFNWRWNHQPIYQRFQFTHLASVSLLFFASVYKKLEQCAKSLGFLIQRAYQSTVPVPLQKRRTVPTYRTRTITIKTYRTSVPYFLPKIEAYRTELPSLPTACRVAQFGKFKYTEQDFSPTKHLFASYATPIIVLKE